MTSHDIWLVPSQKRQWVDSVGSGYGVRVYQQSICLCLNYLFFNHQHFARFPKALNLWTSLSELSLSDLSVYTIRHRKNLQQLTMPLYEQRRPGGNVIIRVSSINTDVLSSSHECVWDRPLASGHEHLVFTVHHCGPTTFAAIKSTQPMAVKTKLISAAHGNGCLQKRLTTSKPSLLWVSGKAGEQRLKQKYLKILNN